MSDFDEQMGLQGSYTGRPESPYLEGAAAKSIEEALRALIETKYLYQKFDVDLARVDAAVKQAVHAAGLRAATPGAGTTHSVGMAPIEATPQRLKALREEVANRPWRLSTRHMGDTREVAQIHRAASVGVQALGIPQDAMEIRFLLPAIHLLCPGPCKRETTFNPLVSSEDSGFGSPFPREGRTGREQIYVPVYRCEMCRQTIYTLLIRRVGLRLHLCGFAPRREPFPIPLVPAPFDRILADAEQAVAEGDVFAGIYHLRTMLEHYLKARLGVPVDDASRGEELVSRHNTSLGPSLGGVLPSLASAYEKLSKCLHARKGVADDYAEQKAAVCKHIDALRALER
jgi:hypothetical protein